MMNQNRGIPKVIAPKPVEWYRAVSSLQRPD
jgi:hypothetical protein